MTLTLQKVSQISHISLRLMSPNETDMIFHDLKSLISIDLPDAEIKKGYENFIRQHNAVTINRGGCCGFKRKSISIERPLSTLATPLFKRRRQKNNKIERSKDSKNTDNGKRIV